MPLARPGSDQREATAHASERRSRKKLPPSKRVRTHRQIEAIKGVSYLGRKPEKVASWGYAR